MAIELLSEAPSVAVRAELARNVMELDQLVEEERWPRLSEQARGLDKWIAAG